MKSQHTTVFTINLLYSTISNNTIYSVIEYTTQDSNRSFTRLFPKTLQ